MIILIDNYDSFTYNLYQLLDTEVLVVRNDAITPDEIAAKNPDGIVLSPGPGTPDQSGICLDVIQTFSGKIPLLGVCLGHQAIAQVFGGKVILSEAVIHGKAAPIFHTQEGLFSQMKLPFNGARYHSLIVEKETLPPCLTTQAESAMGELMAIKHVSHETYGIQFHPESILTEGGELLLKQFVALCEEAK